jgi:nitroreductase
MDTTFLKQSINSSQHCQRNWDLSKTIDPAHMDVFIHAVTQCPSKQNHAYYTVKFITNRDIIEQILDHTWSNKSNKHLPGPGRTNPQVLANLLVLFEGYSYEQTLDNLFAHPDGKIFFEKEGPDKIKNLALISTLTSIGIASGYLNLIANQLGYKTGFCECFDQLEIAKIVNTTQVPKLFLGIGYPDDNKERWRHHVDDSRVVTKPKEPIEYSIIS